VAAEVAGEADATAPLHAARGRGSHLGVGVGADLDVRADDAVELDLGVRLQVHAGARARGYVHRRAIRIEAEAAIGDRVPRAAVVLRARAQPRVRRGAAE